MATRAVQAKPTPRNQPTGPKSHPVVRTTMATATMAPRDMAMNLRLSIMEGRLGTFATAGNITPPA